MKDFVFTHDCNFKAEVATGKRVITVVLPYNIWREYFEDDPNSRRTVRSKFKGSLKEESADILPSDLELMREIIDGDWIFFLCETKKGYVPKICLGRKDFNV